MKNSPYLLPLASLVCCTTLQAAVLDIQPGDFVALKPGEVGVTAFLYQRELVGPYAAGKQVNSAAIRAEAAALRYSSFHEVAGLTWAWSLTPLWTQARLAEGVMPAAFGREAQGAGDVRVSATLWPLADRERGEFLALSLIWFPPTGEYSNQQVLNSGENRHKFALLAGWSTPLSPAWRLELIPELAFYGRNDDYLGGRTRQQDASLALTGYLRWRVAPQWELLAGAQVNSGGATRFDGVAQHDAARNHRLMFGASYFLDHNTVLSLRYGADTRAENGFKLDREWLLRIGRRF